MKTNVIVAVHGPIDNRPCTKSLRENLIGKGVHLPEHHRGKRYAFNSVVK